MKEEEIIKNIENRIVISLKAGAKYIGVTREEIQGLIDLYNKEKEKNRILEEKQNSLAFKTNNYMNEVLSNNIISKDKIREKIKVLEMEIRYDFIDNTKAIKVLKQLLEE